MGTPQFAVPTLEALVASQHEIVLVVTNPDRPAGRGRKLRPPPVKLAAQDAGLPLLQPDSIDAAGMAAALIEADADAFVVVAFSILPRDVLAIPRLGSINLHPSLLPAYRGAAPIVWALFAGERQTGLTTFLLNERIDGGDILLQETVDIEDDETAGELEQRLSRLGADVVVRTCDGLATEQLQPAPQPRRSASRAPKLSKADGRLDWSQTTQVLRNRIRGANPMPGAFTEWDGKTLKIHRATTGLGHGDTGVILDVTDGITVATGDGALCLTEVQPEGRPRMPADDFVRGYQIEKGLRLGDGPSP
ncbi:MAG: methionyl-tRNA formyltransferase [Gemmatimonadetes bacterium]|nr:methionyl-tRNA formyltransferase [Gemmatimonadota bacterium]MBT5586753.1 methionyl-tRNA formyltransferase [Gemmatimonadota bacterium]MBT5960876.1 methionyl-tRNA formyltransferase [Gemmatimonadota bacterium]MBT6627492.1 methionyl-tRNA formyltransferase [Gemmatimonadota bacterium]MBT7457003.1 methionyl-tRNA formyltransferase [Gemmatimonadota bacterium]